MRAKCPQILRLAVAVVLLVRAHAADAPYPPSRVFRAATLAPASETTPLDSALDNWPLTWSADEGGQNDLVKQASSMLAVDGRVYLWLPHKENAQLAWSDDHGSNWTLAPWTLVTSFGYPVFLQFEKDNQGARDEFIYVYSHDHHSASHVADRMVLARVRKDRITHREGYEFFGAVEDNEPYWVSTVEERTGVFTARSRCFRSAITYHPASKRYLWVQTFRTEASRTGLGIYDGPQPWGPWTTLLYDENWESNPADNVSLPAQWISPDGRTAELVFSTDGAFFKRRIEFQFNAE